MSVDWRESFAYTEDDLALALRWGWIKRRQSGAPKGQFEETRFKEENPELAIAYTKTIPTRPFKIRW